MDIAIDGTERRSSAAVASGSWLLTRRTTHPEAQPEDSDVLSGVYFPIVTGTAREEHMPERDGYEHGVPSWVDLGTTDVEDAKRFYTGLFGWEFGDMPTDQEGMDYITVRFKLAVLVL
jgi:hypothetical protein